MMSKKMNRRVLTGVWRIIFCLALLGACSDSKTYNIISPEPCRKCQASADRLIVDSLVCKGHDFEHNHETGDGRGHCHD